MQKQVEYSEAIKTKYPEQIVVVVARDEDGKANPVTVGWSMIASGSPPMMAIALAPKRHTTEAIRHSKCFTIVFPSSGMDEVVMFFGTKSGRDVDKLELTACKNEPAAKIDSVILSDAAANFECELVHEFTTGDHQLFVGKVVATHMNSERSQRLYTIAAGGKIGTL